MSYSFPRAVRLTKAADFRTQFQTATKVKSRGLAGFIRSNDLAYSRLGIIIPKRCVHTAVARNRLKRIIRENFRLRRELFAEYDIAIFVYKGAETASNEEVRGWLEKLWQKLISGSVNC